MPNKLSRKYPTTKNSIRPKVEETGHTPLCNGQWRTHLGGGIQPLGFFSLYKNDKYVFMCIMYID